MMNMSRAERAFFLAFAFLIASLITMFNDFMTAALWFGLYGDWRRTLIVYSDHYGVSVA
jgi:hypothetical protein